jgi:hypothetical protein
MDKTVAELLESDTRYRRLDEAEQLKAEFRKALDAFVDVNYPQGIGSGSLMCSIHDSFPSHHSCVGCNLNGGMRLVERFLLQSDNLYDVDYAFTTFLLLLYLSTEQVLEYFGVINIPEQYRLRHFQVFQEVKYWANFLKHPKSFMLVLHPTSHYVGMAYDDPFKDEKPPELLIDAAFVKKYYSGGKNNKELYHKLARKDNVVVVFPNPSELMTRFMKAQQKFVSFIAENEMVREMLESETMVGKHFSAEQNDELD